MLRTSSSAPLRARVGFGPLVALVLGAAVAGCDTLEYTELQPAELDVSSSLVEFGSLSEGGSRSKTISITNTGDVPLGIASIELVSSSEPDHGHEGSFTVTWDPASVIVPVAGQEETAARGEAGADAAPPTGTEETGPPGQTTEELAADALVLTLEPGARLPITVEFNPTVIGDNYDALVVRTADETVGGNGNGNGDGESQAQNLDRAYRDADTTWRMVYLHGTAETQIANVVVSPRTVDYGFVWPGQESTRFVSVLNVGDGPLTVMQVAVDGSNCSDGFSLEYAPDNGSVLPGGTSGVLEMRFAPLDTDEAQCAVNLRTDDPDSPDIEVLYKANVGENADNRAPTAEIHWPPVGHRVVGWESLQLDVSVLDADQPPSSLVCKVRSGLQLNASLTNCTPSEQNGRLLVDVPMDYLEPGVDVLVVQVTDDSEVTRSASVPVLVNVPYPEDDDDGDGFSPTDPIWPDCNDQDPYTYPFAAERFDGRDNDCDLQVDENTDGADDDQDGMSEADGDCNDNSASTYLGAPELQDGADNDCDGVVDEGTSAFDDDQDGFAEVDLDCDDNDPDLNPAALELCSDGIDNNCNGLKDSQEPCLEIDSAPMIVGGIDLTRTSIEEGEATVASVLVYDADGDEITNTWETEADGGTIDDVTASTITWVAPEELPNNYDNGNVYQLYFVGADDDDNQVWAFEEVWVYPSGSLDPQILQEVAGSADSGGCSTVPVAPGLLLTGLGVLMAVGRRRREEDRA